MVQKKQPLRMCVACREMKNKRDLIRIVRTPEGELFLDDTGKKSGRGVYICANNECFLKACKAKSIERALNKPLSDELRQALKSKLTAGINND